ncbi:MAG: nucleotidyltransferase family protein [Actinomycetota bacterium]|nr:nucleotidyltransferase family protein [Actinomycetota bacterium]
MSVEEEQMIETLKRVAVVLKEKAIPFALAGGNALYAHGGPSSEHDCDFVLRREDVPAATKALEHSGFRIEHPDSEDWLVKVWDEDRLVDLIFEVANRPVDEELLSRALTLEVQSVQMPVQDVTDIMVSKLIVLNDHYCDFARLIPPVRALREKIDWPRLEDSARESPYARAFVFLMRELDVAPPAD